MSVGVMCGCMPYLASFFRRHRVSLPDTASLKRLVTRATQRSSESEKTQVLRLNTFNRVRSNPPIEGMRVEQASWEVFKGGSESLAPKMSKCALH
jgi:hypothetical protein